MESQIWIIHARSGIDARSKRKAHVVFRNFLLAQTQAVAQRLNPRPRRFAQHRQPEVSERSVLARERNHIGYSRNANQIQEPFFPALWNFRKARNAAARAFSAGRAVQ